jgi:hypothetical protein
MFLSWAALRPMNLVLTFSCVTGITGTWSTAQLLDCPLCPIPKIAIYLRENNKDKENELLKNKSDYNI